MKTRLSKSIILSLWLVSSIFAIPRDSTEVIAPTTAEVTAQVIAEAIAEAKVESAYNTVSQPFGQVTVQNVEQITDSDLGQVEEQYFEQVTNQIINQKNDVQYEDLPRGLYQALIDSDFFDLYAVDFNMSPYFQRGDFNGDGDFEIAILIIGKANRNRGVIIMHNDNFSYHIIGAVRNSNDLTENVQKPNGEQTSLPTRSSAL